MDRDLEFLNHAVRLARQAQQAGNLPVGAVISFDGQIVAAGRNSIWVPELRPSRHAEIEALAAVPSELGARSQEMTLYTTLEPCLMCAGAILLHRIGRVVFGAIDSWGGASCALGHLPPAFTARLQAVEWVGPALPEVCDELFESALVLIEENRRRFG
jgi:tRNA(adenine34) deaminase